MTTFAIVLNNKSDKAWNAVKENWPESHFIVSDTLAMISGDRNKVLTSQIRDKVGMGEHEDITGIVLQISYYDGFNATALWEWMEKHS